MKKLELNQMEEIQGDGWARCAAGIIGGGFAGSTGASGNGIAFMLGPVGVGWTAIGAIGGALLGGASTC